MGMSVAQCRSPSSLREPCVRACLLVSLCVQWRSRNATVIKLLLVLILVRSCFSLLTSWVNCRPWCAEEGNADNSSHFYFMGRIVSCARASVLKR